MIDSEISLSPRFQFHWFMSTLISFQFISICPSKNFKCLDANALVTMFAQIASLFMNLKSIIIPAADSLICWGKSIVICF